MRTGLRQLRVWDARELCAPVRVASFGEHVSEDLLPIAPLQGLDPLVAWSRPKPVTRRPQRKHARKR